LSSPTSIWKGDWRDQRSTSRNFADYYDCRTHISCGHVSNDLPPIHDLFLRLVGMYFGVPVHGLTSSADTWHHGGDFNLFRFRRPRRRQRNGGLEQSFPHRDTDERAPQPHDVNAFAAVLYLNTEAEASGGTRFYDGEFELDAGADVGQDGEEDIETLVDTSDAKVLAEVPMRFNSLLLYPGNVTHGAWFAHDSDMRFGDSQRHPGVSQWRISQVIFSRPQHQLLPSGALTR